MTTRTSLPSVYTCAHCNAHGCRLWRSRACSGRDATVICAVCARAVDPTFPPANSATAATEHGDLIAAVPLYCVGVFASYAQSPSTFPDLISWYSLPREPAASSARKRDAAAAEVADLPAAKAASSSAAASESDAAASLFECPVCFEQYDEDAHAPAGLACFHGLCMQCVNKCRRDGEVKCPNCRAVTRVGTAATPELPRNFELMRVKRDYEQQRRKSALAGRDLPSRGVSPHAVRYTRTRQLPGAGTELICALEPNAYVRWDCDSGRAQLRARDSDDGLITLPISGISGARPLAMDMQGTREVPRGFVLFASGECKILRGSVSRVRTLTLGARIVAGCMARDFAVMLSADALTVGNNSCWKDVFCVPRGAPYLMLSVVYDAARLQYVVLCSDMKLRRVSSVGGGVTEVDLTEALHGAGYDAPDLSCTPDGRIVVPRGARPLCVVAPDDTLSEWELLGEPSASWRKVVCYRDGALVALATDGRAFLFRPA